MTRAKLLRFTVAAIVFVVAGAPLPASAQVALAWNNCYGTATAANALQYACDGSLDGNYRKLALSFELTAPYPRFEGTYALLEFRSLAPAPLPDYWQVYPTGCRTGVFAFPGAPGPGSATLCDNPFGNGAYGTAIALDPVFHGPGYFRLQAAIRADVPVGGGFPIASGKYWAGNVLIDPVLGDCSGCEQEICIQLLSIEIMDYSGHALPLVLSGPASSSFVTWQGPTPGMCFGATPARNQTWGALKSLYR